MAEVAPKCLFFLFLLLLNGCSSVSGTLVGLSYNAEKNTATSSLGRFASLLKMSSVSESHIRESEAVHRVLSRVSNSGAFVDLFLNENLVENLSDPTSLASLWLKTQLVTSLPGVNIRSITVSGNNDLPRVLLAMKSIHSILINLHVDNEIKVSVAFPVSFLENLNAAQEKYLHRILELIKRTSSFVFVEACVDIDGKSGLEYLFIKSIIHRAAVATSLLSCNDVTLVLRLRSLAVGSELELAEFETRVFESMENSKFAEAYVEVPYREDFVQKEHQEIIHSSRRELSSDFKATVHDGTNPPSSLFPTNPTTMPPVILPPDTPTPTIVTVPATNPVTVTPNNPGPTPIPLPTTTPVTFPPVNPSVSPPVPVSNPVTTPAPITVPGAQPVTNPVTTYPAPTGNVPGTTPVTNPVTAPVTNPVTAPPNTNAPAVPGQSWCVARSGSPETSLQTALDYACGVGGADCSQIQQSGSCYNPNTLQNHASYAFNSYYQKNPSASSCDFGGTATVVNVNPSSGSCIYSSSSSSSSTASLPTPSTPPTNPATTPSSPAAGISSIPPSDLNQSNPASAYGSEIPPADTTSESNPPALHPLMGAIILLASFII